jgi:hypothetical protein
MQPSMSTESSTERQRSRLERVPRTTWLVLGAWGLGSVVGEFAYCWTYGPLAERIWLLPSALLLSVLVLFVAIRMHLAPLTLAFYIAILYCLLFCWTHFGGTSSAAWFAAQTMMLTSGGLLIIAGWSGNRGTQILALFVVVAVAGVRYGSQRYWVETMKRYRPDASSGREHSADRHRGSTKNSTAV